MIGRTWPQALSRWPGGPHGLQLVLPGSVVSTGGFLKFPNLFALNFLQYHQHTFKSNYTTVTLCTCYGFGKVTLTKWGTCRTASGSSTVTRRALKQRGHYS